MASIISILRDLYRYLIYNLWRVTLAPSISLPIFIRFVATYRSGSSKSYISVCSDSSGGRKTATFYGALGTDSKVICLASSHFSRSHPTINCRESPSVVRHGTWLQFSTLRSRNFTRSTQGRIVPSSLACASFRQ